MDHAAPLLFFVCFVPFVVHFTSNREGLPQREAAPLGPTNSPRHLATTISVPRAWRWLDSPLASESQMIGSTLLSWDDNCNKRIGNNVIAKELCKCNFEDEYYGI